MSNIFYQSHNTYISEKFYSLLSETDNLSNLLKNYREGYAKKHTLLKGTRISKSYEKLSGNIDSFLEKIKLEYKNSHDKLENLANSDNELNYHIEYGNILDVLKEYLEYYFLIFQKSIQIINEAEGGEEKRFLCNKRYSSKVLNDFLETHVQCLYQTISGSDDASNILSFWSHSDTHKANKSMSMKNKIDYVSYSFYYHDVVWTLPTIIDHEVILISLRKDMELKGIIEELKKTLSIENSLRSYCLKIMEEGDFDDDKKYNNRKFIDEFVFFININFEKIIYEFTADYLGYLIYGDAYKVSFFHETLGKHYGEKFYTENKNFIQNILFVADPLRDSLLIRQILLLQINSEIVPRESSKLCNIDNAEYLKKVRRVIIEKVAGESAENRFDANVINDISNVISNFKLYDACMELIIQKLSNFCTPLYDTKTSVGKWKEYINKFKDKVEHFEKKDLITKYKVHSSLWNQRFEHIKTSNEDKIVLPHRSIIRKLMMEDAARRQNIEIEDIPYLLRTKACLSKEDKDIGFVEEKIYFGHEGVIEIKQVDNKMINYHDLLCRSGAESSYDIEKHALLKLKLINNVENEEELNFSVEIYMFVYLIDTQDVKNLFKEIVKKELETGTTNKSYKIDIYKSLGSEDFVFHIMTNQKDIWNTIEEILERNNRFFIGTSSVIILPYNTKIINEIKILAYYKSKSTLKYSEFKSSIEQAVAGKNIGSYKIYDIHGNYDFEIRWDIKSLDSLIKIHQVLKDNHTISKVKQHLANSIDNRSKRHNVTNSRKGVQRKK